MKHTIYIYADLLHSRICINTYNFWITEKEIETRLYLSDVSSYQLLEVREIEINIDFDFTTGKIKALQHQLGNLHIQAENVKAQIQELLAIGHEKEEHMKEQSIGDENHFAFDDEPF